MEKLRSREVGFVETLVVAISCAVQFAFVLPLQSYLSNAASFGFALKDLLPELLIRFASLALLIVAAIRIAPRRVRVIALAFVLAGAVGAYLETGILSIGLPRLTGNVSGYANVPRSWFDGVALGLALVAVSLACIRIRACRIWIAVIVCAMSLVSLLDIRREREADGSRLVVHDFLPCRAIAGQVRYSTTRNILLFVIDSLSAIEARTILNDADCGPRLRDRFDGFVAYHDNVGMHADTNFAMAGLLTGRYLEDPAQSADYAWSIYARPSVLSDFLNAGFSVYMMPGAFNSGFSSDARGTRGEDPRARPMARRIGDQQNWNLDEIVVFRALPYAFKLPYYERLTRKWTYCESSVVSDDGERDERTMFPLVGNRLASTTSQGVFLYLHTTGTHVPVRWNRKGEPLDKPVANFHAVVEQGVYVLGQLADLLDGLKRNGLYDNALIVVAADHAGHYDVYPPPARPELPPRARPFLWVKGVGERGRLQESMEPTTHANIARVLRAGRERKLSNAEIGQMLTADRRLYRCEVGGRRMDWIVDRKGQVTFDEGAFAVDVEKLRPIEAGRDYSFVTNVEPLKRADAIFDHCSRFAFAPLFRPQDEEMSFRFRVDGDFSRCDVSVDLGMYDWDGSGRSRNGELLVFDRTADGAAQTVVRFADKARCRVTGVQAVRGIVDLGIRRKGVLGEVFVEGIRVERGE